MTHSISRWVLLEFSAPPSGRRGDVQANGRDKQLGKKSLCLQSAVLLTFKVSALLPFKASCFDFPFTVVVLAAPGRKETRVRVKEQLQEHN